PTPTHSLLPYTTLFRSRFQTQSPMQQIERAREQQLALRTALQSLQDSLRQRVKPLGVPFGQTAISNAEVEARKQLDALHFTLGGDRKSTRLNSSHVSIS